MKTFTRIMYKVGMLLFIGAVLVSYSPSTSAAPACFNAKLYVGPDCAECEHIKQDASASIAVLTRAKRLEVVTLDTQGSVIAPSLPDFQVLDENTGKLLELFQAQPIEIVPESLLVRDVSEISLRLGELAAQRECTIGSSNTSSLLSKISARGFSSSIIDALSNAIASLLLRLFDDGA